MFGMEMICEKTGVRVPYVREWHAPNVERKGVTRLL